MKNATLRDLVVSAQAAANEAAAPNEDGSPKDVLAIETMKLAKFEASGFDRADFATWCNSFLAQLEMHAAFSKQDSPATAAARRQATAPATA